MSVTATSTMTRRESTRTRRPAAAGEASGRRAGRSGSPGIETLALLAIAILLVAGAFLSARPAAQMPPLAQLTVQAGDSLWTLAEAHPVDGLSTAQVAELIAGANGRDGALIAPGECILVPAGTPEERLAAK